MPKFPSCGNPVEDLQKHHRWCAKKGAHLARLCAGFSEPDRAPIPELQPTEPVIEYTESDTNEVHSCSCWHCQSAYVDQPRSQWI